MLGERGDGILRVEEMAFKVTRSSRPKAENQLSTFGGH
jgi:hypothetical protein